MTFNTFTSGIDTSFSTKLNQNFLHVFFNPTDIDSTTDLDLSRNTTGTTTTTKTLSTSAGEIVNYVKITMNGVIGVEAPNSSIGVKIETSQLSASSWTTRVDKSYNINATGSGSTCNLPFNLEYIYTPSAGEKSSGLDVKITVVGTSVSNSAVTYTNIQNILWVN